MTTCATHVPDRQRGYLANLLAALVLLTLAVIGVAWVYLGMMTRDQWPIRWLEVDGSFERVNAEVLRMQEVKMCPPFRGIYRKESSADRIMFEAGAGGYGYNITYAGSSQAWSKMEPYPSNEAYETASRIPKFRQASRC